MIAKSNIYVDSFSYRDDLKELTYLHYFIKEAGRMHPAVPLVGRQLASSRTIDGHQLPKGIGIFINMYACHHNPAVWKDPEVYYIVAVELSMLLMYQ